MKKDCNIGNVRLANPFLLAPLAGVTDAPFRRICGEMGAGLVYSEMVSAKGLWYKDKNTERLLEIFPGEEPIAYQLFGSESDIIAHAAKTLRGRKNAAFDINMGCPVPKVVKNGEGSALLKDPDRIYELVKAAADHAGKPVTAKIRIGWDQDSINAVQTAKAIEAAGAAAVAVHGRTRQQYYTGHADWDMIRRVKENVNIPVIGNGDVFSGEDANRMLKETGCDMVMIARGALGNPWIFRDAIAIWKGDEKPPAPSLEQRVQTMLIHLERLTAVKGEYAAVREMRKHVGWYLKGIRGSAAVRRTINRITDLEELRREIERIGE